MNDAAPIRVLLIDDHEMFVESIARLLSGEGFEVVATASNGEDGVRRAEEFADRRRPSSTTASRTPTG